MTHKIINTENYLLVVDDSEIKAGDWFINLISKELLKCFKNSAVKSLGGKTINMTEKWLNNNDCKRIIAHLPLNNSPVLEGVALLPPIEDEAESLSLKSVNKRGYTTDDYQDGFEDGYNKAKEKYKYTEEDLKKAINLAYVSGGGGDTYQECEEFVFEQLESLQQPKYPVAFECEILVELPIDWDGKGIEPKKTTNSQGLTQWVGRYIYG